MPGDVAQSGGAGFERLDALFLSVSGYLPWPVLAAPLVDLFGLAPVTREMAPCVSALARNEVSLLDGTPMRCNCARGNRARGCHSIIVYSRASQGSSLGSKRG